jgi:hypothetical protein
MAKAVQNDPNSWQKRANRIDKFAKTFLFCRPQYREYCAGKLYLDMINLT